MGALIFEENSGYVAKMQEEHVAVFSLLLFFQRHDVAVAASAFVLNVRLV